MKVPEYAALNEEIEHDGKLPLHRNQRRDPNGTRPQLFLLYNLIIPYNTYILT